MNKVYLNGKIIAENKASLSIRDRGFTYGDAVFETIRVYNGLPFLLKEHLKRLKKAGQITKIKIPSDLDKAVIKLIKANKLVNDSSIRITISRGVDNTGYELKSNLKPTVTITSQKIDGKKIKNNQKKGIKVETNTLLSLAVEGIKSTNLLNMILSKNSAKGAGAQDIICLDNKGNVTEALTGNVFLVKNNTLFTAPLSSGILAGVTRDAVIKIALKNKLKVKETLTKASNLLTYDEIFITNSIQEVIPVTGLNKQKLPVGQVTLMLQNDYNQLANIPPRRIK